MTTYPPPELKLMSGSIAIAYATLAFLLYLFIFPAGRSSSGPGNNTALIRRVLYQRMLGALLFGLIPALIVVLVFKRPLNHYGVSGESLLKSFLWWLPAAAGVVILNFLFARQESNLAVYPQIRVSRWNHGLLLGSAISWIIYLLGYEFLFRGFMLFSCLENFGYWPALIINVCLYSLFHVYKGPREAFGSMFFGILLCFLTLRLGNLWFAVFIHITMALSNEWFSLDFHPEMELIKKNMKE